MIEAPAVMLLAWILGLGPGRGGERPPKGNGKGKIPPTPVVPLPDVGAWPRTVPQGGEKKMVLTGSPTETIAWRKSHYAAVVDFLANDNRSIDALTHLVDTHAVETGNFDINQIALAVVTHWDIETASGTHEYNYNVGGILALPGQQYYAAMDVQSKQHVAFAAYNGELDGIADYFGVLSYKRYASALAALLMLPTDPGWFSELGWAGYYGMDPVAAEKLWAERRASVAVDVGLQ